MDLIEKANENLNKVIKYAFPSLYEKINPRVNSKNKSAKSKNHNGERKVAKLNSNLIKDRYKKITHDEISENSYIIDDKDLRVRNISSGRHYLIVGGVNQSNEKDVFFVTLPSNTGLPSIIELKKKLKTKDYNVHHIVAEKNEIDLIFEFLKDKAARGPSSVSYDDSPYEEFFDKLLEEAMNRGVSDIHIEIRNDTASIRMRENGQLNVYNKYSVKWSWNLVRVIYSVVAEEKQETFKPRIPQDAVADRMIKGSKIRVRIATIPASSKNMDMVLRLLPINIDREVLTLEQLGYTKKQQLLLERAALKPYGCFIISGSTGSGKSTTLKHIIGAKVEEYDGRIKVITVEDPPEYMIYGITQSPVVRSTNESGEQENGFVLAVRASMRCDPDILMVGEVRDYDTASLLISAVLSGHQAFTTVHASTALGIVPRLQGMGVSSDVISSGDFIGALINQTLCPTICPKCSIPAGDYDYENSPKYKSAFERIIATLPENTTIKDTNIRILNESGCPHCNKTGITGRQVIAEVILPDEELRSILATGNIAASKIYWVQKMDGETKIEDGYEKLMRGLFDPLHLEHKVGPIDDIKEIWRLKGSTKTQ